MEQTAGELMVIEHHLKLCVGQLSTTLVLSTVKTNYNVFVSYAIVKLERNVFKVFLQNLKYLEIALIIDVHNLVFYMLD